MPEPPLSNPPISNPPVTSPRLTTVASARYWLRAALVLIAAVLAVVYVQRILVMATEGSIQVRVAGGVFTPTPPTQSWGWYGSFESLLFRGVLAQSWLLLTAGLLMAVRRWGVAIMLPLPRAVCPACSYPASTETTNCPECGLRLREHPERNPAGQI